MRSEWIILTSSGSTTWENPCLYLVMELLDGLTLQEVSRRVGPLPVADAVEVAIQALEGLSHAYGRGVVHRDIAFELDAHA